MKHIGILGHSAEGSALCYLAACHEGSKRLGKHMHPTITMDIFPMGEAMEAWENDDISFVRNIFFEGVERLKAAGCHFFVCPDNTAHIALESPGKPFPIPGLHIAQVVAEEAKAKGFCKIGILGTKWTMEGSVYPEAFKRVGCDFMSPEKEDRLLVDKVIFEELCCGIFKESSVKEFLRIIEWLKQSGCDAVVLGCTEIPLIITPENSPLPSLDSTRLLAKAAVELSLNEEKIAHWFGGGYKDN